MNTGKILLTILQAFFKYQDFSIIKVFTLIPTIPGDHIQDMNIIVMSFKSPQFRRIS